jgi:hypothetical protein
MRPATKSGRPDFFFGFSNRIVMAPLLTVSHDDCAKAVQLLFETNRTSSTAKSRHDSMAFGVPGRAS